MSEEKIPKPETDEEKAAVEVAKDSILSSEMLIFSMLERKLPQVADRLREDYKAWTQARLEVSEELGEETTNADIKKRLPENKWIHFLERKVGPMLDRLSPTTEEELEAAREDFSNEVQRRLKGDDVS